MGGDLNSVRCKPEVKACGRRVEEGNSILLQYYCNDGQPAFRLRGICNFHHSAWLCVFLSCHTQAELFFTHLRLFQNTGEHRMKDLGRQGSLGV